MGGVRTPIPRRPRRLSADRRAAGSYTLIWEGPRWPSPKVCAVSRRPLAPPKRHGRGAESDGEPNKMTLSARTF
jgi:hypothetical protein